MNTKFSRMTLRLPMNMREWLESKTDISHRTLTAEVVEMIREAMEKEEKQKAA